AGREALLLAAPPRDQHAVGRGLRRQPVDLVEGRGLGVVGVDLGDGDLPGDAGLGLGPGGQRGADGGGELVGGLARGRPGEVAQRGRRGGHRLYVAVSVARPSRWKYTLNATCALVLSGPRPSSPGATSSACTAKM